MQTTEATEKEAAGVIAAVDTEVVSPVPAPAQAEFSIPLTEFCTRRSATDNRVELIGGFYTTEKLAGRLRDTETNYTARLEAFAKQPVV